MDDATKNSKQENHTSQYLPCPSSSITLYPMFSTMQFNDLKNEKPDDSVCFVPSSEAPSWYSDIEHCVEKSESDSCTDEEEEEEASLEYDELVNDGKAKKKIELLAAMVGVDTTEPAIVLAQVVRVLKHLKKINHC